jgi:hypothetical protein
MDIKKEIATIKDDVQSIKSILDINNEVVENTSTGGMVIEEKVKYVDRKIQRAYWYDNELIEAFDKNFPAKRFDKSKIMNEMLKIFLIDRGLI